MRSLSTIIAILTMFCLPISCFAESALDRSVKKKYGELAVQKLKTLQYPGKLYPGISQDRNEENDEAAQKTKQNAQEGIEQEKSKKTMEIMKSAVDSYRKGMGDWAGENEDLEALEPLKSISAR